MKKIFKQIFDYLDKQNILLVAGSPENFNIMTIGWIHFGRLWKKHNLIVYVRPSRYTYEFLENFDFFSVNFFKDDYKEVISFFGSYSGRNVDKKEYNKLTKINYKNLTIYLKESFLSFICKKIYFADLIPSNILEKDIKSIYYINNDYHRLYFGDILEVIEN